MSKERAKTPRGHYHVEAFCLMRYACQGKDEFRPPTYQKLKVQVPCGHHEIIWNSRDGVTPFGTTCPSCGGNLQHVFFGSDKYAPEHKLNPGQKFWRDMTMVEAMKLTERRLEMMRVHYPEMVPESPEKVEAWKLVHATEVLEEHGGGRPWLDVEPW